MRKALFLAVLLFAQTAWAATAVEKWVDTDCADNGDGTQGDCAKTPGAAGPYNSLTNALTGESAARPNLVSNDESLTIMLQGTAADTTAVYFDPAFFTTDATHTVRLKGAETATGRHPGYWSTSHYRLSAAACSGGAVLLVNENNVLVDDFQIENTGTADAGCNNGIGLSLSNGAYSNVYANGMFVRGNPAGAPQVTSYGIYMTYLQGARTVYIANNITTGVSNAGLFIGCNASDQITVYNNTSYGNAYGIRIWKGTMCNLGGATIHAKNNLLQGNSSADWNIPSTGGGTPTYDISSNVTSDATSPNGATFQNRTASFVNPAGLDFHLQKNDTAALNACVSLAADATYAFVRDVEYTLRATKWDCGADEQPDQFRMGFLGVEW